MTLKQAQQMIGDSKRVGYSVHFEWIKGPMLASDCFPDTRDGEEPLKTEQEAWKLAAEFARATVGKTCNLYVIDAYTYVPVAGYKEREISNR